MAKTPDITTITTGYYSTTALSNNFDNIVDSFSNTLSLDGSTPNAMGADLDMNGYNIDNCNSLLIDGTDVFAMINKVTISTSSPSGGSNNDIWFKVST